MTAIAAPTREPKYYLVKRHILRLAESLPAGSMLPTERALADQLMISRGTVRQATGELISEGRLTRRQGAGTFLTESKVAWSVHPAGPSGGASGARVEATLVSHDRRPASPALAELLRVERRARVLELDWVLSVNGSPMAFEQVHVAAARFPVLARAARDGSLYETLSAGRAACVTAADAIESAPAPQGIAALLGTDTGTSMLVLTRHGFDAAGEPTEWSQTWYRGDRCTLIANCGGWAAMAGPPSRTPPGPVPAPAVT